MVDRGSWAWVKLPYVHGVNFSDMPSAEGSAQYS